MKSLTNSEALGSESLIAENTLKTGPNMTIVGDKAVDSRVFLGVGRKQSRESSQAPFETLFRDFYLSAEPVYNFWTPDEEQNESEPRGDRDLSDVPRYIVLRWGAAPVVSRRAGTPEKNDPRAEPSTAGEFSPLKTVAYRGANFSPTHLSDMGVAVSSLANGYFSPGSLSAVIDGATDPVPAPETMVDEDSFLGSRDTEGLSLQEVVANKNTLSRQFFPTDGRVAYSMDASAGTLRVYSVTPSSPTLGMTVNVASSLERVATVSDPEKILQTVSLPPPESSDSYAKAVFVSPNIAGVLSSDRVNSMTSPEHAESTAAVAQFIPNLEVIATVPPPRVTTIPSFPAPEDQPNLEYVGYIIEKYKRLPSGVFSLVETFQLPRRDFDEYVDTKVAYGTVYRYRMKVIARWTRKVGGAEQTFAASSTARPTTSNLCSYFGGEWSREWSYASVIDLVPPPPPDELYVRPESARKRVHLAMRIPENPQRDIVVMRFLRRVLDASGEELSPWSEIFRTGLANARFEDSDVEFREDSGRTYVYAAQAISLRGELSLLSEQVAVTVTRNYSVFGEDPVRQVSCPGVPLAAHGAFSVRPPRRYEEEIYANSSVRVASRKALGKGIPSDSSYVLRVESLATGETYDQVVRTEFKIRNDGSTDKS